MFQVITWYSNEFLIDWFKVVRIVVLFCASLYWGRDSNIFCIGQSIRSLCGSDFGLIPKVIPAISVLPLFPLT